MERPTGWVPLFKKNMLPLEGGGLLLAASFLVVL